MKVWREQSLRVRLTVLTTAALAAALGVAGWIFLGALETSLTNSADDTARQQALDVAALLDAGRLPDPIPATGSASIQLVDRTGRITAASAGADRMVPLFKPDSDGWADGQAHYVDGRPYGIPDDLRVVSVPAAEGAVVIAAASLTPVSESGAAARTALIVGAPLLLALLGGASWLVIGSTLRPINELRQEAESIGSTPSRRLPLPEAEDEVRHLAETLNGMLARLEESSVRQRAFVSDAAHELRSPLASIRTQLEVAAAHGADLTELVEDLLADTLRLSRLADDLLALARIDELGGLTTKRIDLAELARSVTGDAQVTDDGPVVIEADPDAVGRAIGNLVDNAARHAASTVTVDVHAEGPWATVVVTDDGPGIPEADRERVFARFTRLDDARSRDPSTGGAGLGLAIVREAVRAHHGEVTLGDAAPGLRATVRLPRPTQ